LLCSLARLKSPVLPPPIHKVGATLNAYLDGEAFDSLPSRPPSPLLASGAEVFLVARQSGVVRALPGRDAVAKLASFRAAEWQVRARACCGRR